MGFTHEQISEIISEITNGESGFHGLVKRGLESLMLTERSLHNETLSDVSNGFRGRRVCHGGKVFELRVPRSRNSNFYPMLLGVLKDQEEEAQKLVSSLYCSGLTTEQVGKIYEQFYGKHYSKSQVSRLLNTAREDVNAWLGRKLEKRYPILYIDATYVLTRRDESVSNEAYYTVLGVKEDRTREVLTVVNFPVESATNWKDVFEDLKARGVQEVNLLVCDGRLTGIENVLALRGDIPQDGSTPKEYHYASELIREIKKAGDFCIGAACYPEGHVESANKTVDIDYLKQKVEAGCDFVTTQMFFDNSILYSYLYRIREKGIQVPVIAGIMPVTNAKQIRRITQMSGTYLPSRFMSIVDRFGDNPAAMKQAGIAYATDQIIDLIANGVNGIHVYSMNKPDVAMKIKENLSEIL